MKVKLLSYTNNAEDLLLFTKNTRLKMSPFLLDEISSWTPEKKKEELDYMVNTIKSSWEFVDYVFIIEGVSRAFTHQFVRNRQGSYAQQTMRMLDVSGFEYVTGPSIENNPDLNYKYHAIMEIINEEYQKLIEGGAAVEDARGILPTNICTNIVAKYNLRTLSELVASRASPRTQAEFRSVMDAMYEAVIEVHPWAKPFLHDQKFDALKVLESHIIDTYEGTDKITMLLKKIDILRK
jgi:flavin-dependent thymidylate synthase